VQHRDLGTVRIAGPVVAFSDTPLQAGPLAALGEHTDEVLGELGYQPAEIDRWRQSGVI
jgi:crotonobetainyl-CoA:carnitine CoA-transferase CaiB-like acyl-CoA transferase